MARSLGRPEIDLALERNVQAFCRRLIADGVALSAHDCSDGGLALALAESCVLGDASVGEAGAQRDSSPLNEFAEAIPKRWDVGLFGEAASRILMAVHS